MEISNIATESPALADETVRTEEKKGIFDTSPQSLYLNLCLLAYERLDTL